MKMYYLNPNDYGSEYFVMAASKNEAIFLISKSGKPGSEEFIGIDKDNLPEKYTIDEHEYGSVVRTQIA